MAGRVAPRRRSNLRNKCHAARAAIARAADGNYLPVYVRTCGDSVAHKCGIPITLYDNGTRALAVYSSHECRLSSELWKHARAGEHNVAGTHCLRRTRQAGEHMGWVRNGRYMVGRGGLYGRLGLGSGSSSGKGVVVSLARLAPPHVPARAERAESVKGDHSAAK